MSSSLARADSMGSFFIRPLSSGSDNASEHALIRELASANANQMVSRIWHIEGDRHIVVGQCAAGRVESNRGKITTKHAFPEGLIFVGSKLAENPVAIAPHTNRHLIRHLGRRCARALGVSENVQISEGHRLNKLA